jgi:hypothetical protein
MRKVPGTGQISNEIVSDLVFLSRGLPSKTNLLTSPNMLSCFMGQVVCKPGKTDSYRVSLM